MSLRTTFGRAALAALAAGALAGPAACDHVAPADSGFGGTVNHALGGFESCGALEEYAREAAIQLVRARVESACSGEAGDDVDFGGSGGDTTPVDGDADGDGAEDADDADGDYSSTNNQEEGVDEADLVKTDGDHIYSLHAGELVITAATAAGGLAPAGRAAVGGYANEMFLYGGTAVVFSTFTGSEVPEALRLPDAYDEEYGYVDCFDPWCWYEPAYTQMAIVDVSDPGDPEVVRTVLYGGEYVTARLVASGLRLALFTPVPGLEMVWDTGGDADPWDDYGTSWDDACESTVDLNETRFAGVGAGEILPKKLDSIDGAVSALLGCGDVLGPTTPDGVGVTSIVSLDLDAPLGAAAAVGVFGTRNLVYASPQTMYLATSREYVMAAAWAGLWEGETTGIHAFDIASAPGSAAYVATGEVPGRTLSQFSMGEKDGFLRIATTTGESWDPSALDNHVLVLRVSDGAMRVVGQLDGIGAGEEIYAARFVGDRGFVVTFYETDPLFTLDMSDPYAPALVGQWVGPGYSTYLHPLGEDLLISVGLEDWVPALSLYDLGDLSEPVLVERVLFDSAYGTPAVYEHKAFLLDEERQLLAIPYTGYAWGEGGGDYAYDTGLAVYGVGAGGFEDVGWLRLGSSAEYEGDVLRAVTIGDSVFGVSRCRVASGAFADPADVIDSEPLFTGASCDDVYGYGYGGGGDWD